MINGYQVSQALHVAATLGLSDLLADGPRSVADLAAATGTDERTLLRLLRALASVGVYAGGEEGRFTNTELGEALRSDAPRSVAGGARLIGRPYYWQAWASLAQSVRTGENAFAATHGRSIWEYREQHPDELVIFDRAMTALSGAVAGAVVEAYDFGRSAPSTDAAW